MTEPRSGWHWREWGAELAGVAILFFMVVSAKTFLVRLGPPVDDVWVRVAIVGAVAGLTVVLIARSPLGRRSGAHLNPVVTLGLALLRSVAVADVAGYAVAQAAGGLVGVLAARVWGPSVSGAGVDWAVIAPAGWIGHGSAAAVEAAATAAQLAVVFGCLASARGARWAPVAAGVLLTGAIAGLGPVSGAGFNPVRGMAPDVAAGFYPALWIYVAGPVAGCIMAAAAVAWRSRTPVTAKLVHDPAVPCHMRCALPHTGQRGLSPVRAGSAAEYGTVGGPR